MVVWNIIQASVAVTEDRLDGDYFKPRDLEHIERASKAGGQSLGTLATILNGRTPPLYCDEGGVPVIRSGDLVTPLLFSGNGQSYLKTEDSTALLSLRKGDVLISSIGMGSIGKVGIVCEPAGSVTVSEVTVLRDFTFCPAYLFAYLSTPHGQAQIERQITGATGQQHLLKSKVAKIIIPRPTDSLQEQLEVLVSRAATCLRLATSKYDDAEALLTNALGLDSMDLAPRLFYEDTFAHTTTTPRLDAEYFSPRMQTALQALSAGRKTIGDVALLTKRRFKAIPGTPFDYIEIANIGTAGTAGSNTVPGEDAASRATWIVKPGDIITTTVRPIRRLSAIILPEQDGFVCTSGFAVLRPRDIEPEVLLTYLRLPLVAELLNLYATASMYPAISTTDLIHIPFFTPDAQARAKIVAKIQESFAARTESLRLLDEAKRTVEAAVEVGLEESGSLKLENGG
jgi:restriction endonuclease S subunit